MAKSRHLRRRPSTPNLGHLHRQSFFTADPASPPETPSASPPFSRKYSLRPRRQPAPSWDDLSPPVANDPSIKPVGNGHQFSYQPTFGPEQLSPRSQSSSSAIAADQNDNVPDTQLKREQREHREDDESDQTDDPILEPQAASSEADDEDEGDEDEDDGLDVIGGDKDTAAAPDAPLDAHAAAWSEYLIEEIDSAEGSVNLLEVLYPYEIEVAPTRPHSWHKGLDRTMMRDMRNLNCSNEEASEDEEDVNSDEDDDSSSSSDPEDEDKVDEEEDEDDDEVDVDMELFYQRQQELRRVRRVSMSSSVGKRTHSELSDDEDDFGPLDVNDFKIPR
ncbi:hypothetical protein GMORB2_1395 [Geosmithia morbida]|uniref:Uncharacterized protein n=1 Tax=Geosmithia morbida TaxID=1094350 RepID=A0A9P4Z3W4_9HYPO|nr:uncharacterized protein GMORB2_1395 [Geosmithia morbida]KAF4126149.1 hypothetical protein GMORB2_1395 [Geosmithia morbida]